MTSNTTEKKSEAKRFACLDPCRSFAQSSRKCLMWKRKSKVLEPSSPWASCNCTCQAIREWTALAGTSGVGCLHPSVASDSRGHEVTRGRRPSRPQSPSEGARGSPETLGCQRERMYESGGGSVEKDIPKEIQPARSPAHQLA